MLKDTRRNEAYLNAIAENLPDFEGKVVMDVGAGTGILSMFAAYFGKAKKVYAIEASEVATLASQIVEANGLDSVVEVIQSRVEDLTEEDVPEKVDIILSEWMGFYLLHENMLPSVLYARDHFMAPTGKLFPSHATIYAAPVNVQDYYNEKVAFWGNIHGFSFAPMIPHAVQTMLEQPVVTELSNRNVVGQIVPLVTLDLMQLKSEDLIHVPLSLPLRVASQDTIVHGVGLWWDVVFAGSQKSVVLSTGPEVPPTHWKQSVVMFPQPLSIDVEDDVSAQLELVLQDPEERQYTLSLELV
jgi:predicted RNA methylase